MNSEKHSAAAALAANPQRPAWQMALIALAVLLLLSETLYLALGAVAKNCLAEGAACGPLANNISNALFVNATSESGAPVFSNMFAVGLPGFNNLFYLFLAGIGIDYFGQLLPTVAASIIIGFVILWGYFTTSANRGAAMRFLLAVAFAVGWWVLYNNTEASIYKADFVALASSRYLEIPIGAVSMLLASLFQRRRD